jgi:uncharacterized protein YwgA
MDDIALKAIYRELAGFNESVGCAYAVVKGVPLSLMCYNQPQIRGFGDIDILVSESSFALCKKWCDDNGFVENSSGCSAMSKMVFNGLSHQKQTYLKKHLGFTCELDFNTDVFWGEYEGKRADIDEFLSDAFETVIYGVKVRVLPPLKAAVQLILHHYKDMNSIFLIATRKSIKPEMFRDVYYLLKNNSGEISAERLYGLSLEYEIVPYVYYVLYYTEKLFSDEFMKRYVEKFRTAEGERLLDCYGLCEKERKVWKCDFRTRLDAESLFPLIEPDLTERDKKKIEINKKVFM